MRNALPRRAALATVFVAMGLLALCWSRIDRRPAPLGVDAPEQEFASGRALRTLAQLLGDGAPHPAGSAAHTRVREGIIAALRELGLEPRVDEALARGPGGRVALVRNVVARVFEGGAGKSVLLCAHYDSVGAAPGAGDDGSGVATLIEVARALRTGPPLARPIVLLFTDAEEAGLIGAREFVEHAPESANVGVVINLEARGTGGPSLMFETSGPSAALISHLDRAAVRPFASSLSDLIYKYMPNDTDLSVFRARGVPGFNFAFIGGLEHYHTALDSLQRIESASVQHHGAQALALVRELVVADLEHLDGGDAVYVDLLAWRVISWSRPFAIAAGALLAALACWRVLRRCKRTELRFVDLALAACAATLAFVTACGASWGLTAVLARWHSVPDAGLVHPNVFRASIATMVLACVAGVGLLARRKHAFEAAWSAGALVTSIGALLSSLVLARASHLALLPALAWIVADLALDPCARPARRALALAGIVSVQALLWVPIADATELGFGFRLGPMNAAPMAATLMALWPAWVELERRWLAALAIASEFVSLGLAAFIALQPATSADHPSWLNLRYIVDADVAHAQFEASTFGAELPASLASAASFERATKAPFPWLSLDPSMFVAAAPLWSEPAPQVEVLETSTDGPRRIVKARLSSPRGASRLHLHLPDDVTISSASIGALRLDGGFEGAHTQLFFAVPRDGVDVELELPQAARRIWLLDQDWTLPESVRELQRVRPPSCVARSDGDVSIVGRSLEL